MPQRPVIGRGELNSPNITPNNTFENRGICDTPQRPEIGMGEMNSPNIMPNNSPEYRGICNTPIRQFQNRGVCDMPERFPQNRGVCNTPLRSPKQTVGSIVRGYKSSVTKQLNLLGFNEKLWQRNYHEHIIRNEKSFQIISQYILNNPTKWVEDTFYL